ncbi:DNA-binding MarR family transcriptional regulator [Nocardiopsis sp. Huas11]|uniref:MarR family winged helix-turn-helix transcriptional regulator n=1 Tax=Nocardiopsis sp. Huas11 TaxID=2183912 RepID=UPI000EB48DD7|nr:MarR family transcriptional regulator [Nocardiopsis sp. Huas11]RKS05153.1 DNA-binding MarR family transcriptional regulator [Nocardiopsis sp. Huas11]
MDTASPTPASDAAPGGTSDDQARAELYQALQTDGQQLAVRLVRLLHRMSDRSGMNPTDFQCYTLLRVGGTLTPGEIADSLRLSTGSVTGVIDRLEAHGLVERTRHPRDRRKVAVRLIEGADTFAAASAPGMREAMTRLHEDYTVDELRVITDWLDRVGATLDDLITASD